MKKIFTCILFLSIITPGFSQSQKTVEVVSGRLVRVSVALKDFKPAQSLVKNIKVRDEDGIIGKEEEFEEAPDLPKVYKPFTGDPVLQKTYSTEIKNNNLRSITASFNGISYTNVIPADPSIAVGPNHIIQMVNGVSGALFTVYSKSGTVIIPPTYLDNITGKGGLGDPYAMYDQLADRFIMTEFVNKNETGEQGLSIAVSKTNDPTGAWYVYFFSTGTSFPDYPKFSVWNDAYYAKTNDFNSNNAYIGSTVYAFDRAKMLSGSTLAGMQKSLIGNGYRDFSMIPVSLQGTTLPSPGTGGMFTYLQDNSWTLSSSDSIGFFEFKVDFNNSSNTKIINSTSLAVAEYKSELCSATRGQCVPQPNTSIRLETIDQRIMNQPVYRNFGSYEGIVFTNIVDKGSNISGIRWYEVVKKSGTWSIYQQSTYSPDTTYRFMPSVSYDAKGNIGMAYNVSGQNVFPGIRYTGRKVCDSTGIMSYAENTIVNGSASNTNSRYGDYNQLVCDPDGKIFWFVGMYNNSTTWSTRIAAFTLDSCTSVCGSASQLNTSGITPTSAILNWTGVGNGINYSVDYRVAGSATWMNIQNTASVTSVNLDNLSAGTTYEWRVKSNCVSGSSNYISSQFNTICPVAMELRTSDITSVSATISWDQSAGINNYTIQYKPVNSNAWLTAAANVSVLSTNLTGLTSGTSYEWRVITNCAVTSGVSVSSQFTTLNTSDCYQPVNLSANNISTNGATLTWTSVSSASSYSVDYKLSTSATWINAIANTSALSINLSALTAGAVYDWRVRPNCAYGNSGYSNSQFTTLLSTGCYTPANLSTSAINSTGATFNWATATGASKYAIDYKLNSATTWTSLSTGTTSKSITATRLSPGQLYNWRVKSICSAGSSTYTSTSFTTACSLPTGLTTTLITSSSATISWTLVTGAATYNVEYKPSTSNTWIPVVTNTTLRSFSLTGLTANTIYNWRVISNCTANQSDYASAQFTTLPPPCPDQLEPNNTLASAVLIPVNTEVIAQIASSTDLDYYSFNNTSSQPNIKITLGNMPANYDLKLISPTGTTLLTASSTGTTSETITYNTNIIGNYKVEVYGRSGVYNTTKCYTLKVLIGAANFAPEIYHSQTANSILSVSPVPANKTVSLIYNSINNADVSMTLTDQLGNIITAEKINVSIGLNYYNVNVETLQNGVYYIRIANSTGIATQKIIVVK